MKPLYDIKTTFLPASVKDADSKKGIVTGYFSNFNNVDGDGDIIKPGAFTKTIAERGPKSAQPRIKHLLNHDTSKPVGRLTELYEDAKGLAYESQAGTHKLGKDFIEMVESGLVTEHSIGFKIVKRNQLQDYENYVKNPGAGWYEITETMLWEGSSLTAWGANHLTPITGVKNLSADQLQDLINRQQAVEKFCRNSTASDETIELLLLESKQLIQIICDLKATKPENTSTLPDNEAYKNTIKQFINSLKN